MEEGDGARAVCIGAGPRRAASTWNFPEGGPVLDWPVNDVEVRVEDQSQTASQDCVDERLDFEAAPVRI